MYYLAHAKSSSGLLVMERDTAREKSLFGGKQRVMTTT